MNFEKDNNPIDLKNDFVPVDFSKIKVGTKTLDNAIYELGLYNKVDRKFARREDILKAIHNGNVAEMRSISNFFFDTSGIYGRLCVYMAYMYRYD